MLPTVNSTGDEQFNGNIAAIKWNTPEFGVKAYGYGYDNINRLERAKFAAGVALNADVNKYSVENITYDANGNILTLGRHNTTTSYIDNLEMTYNGNQLKKTYDSGDLVLGFVDMVDYETEYHYDLNGNMDVDDNKGFVFAYNYLNLPEEVVGGTDTVRYIYDATGIKMSKELVQGGAISYTNYVGNFVYKDGDLDYIVTDEGRITQPTAGTFQYEYFLKDHLGNTRTVFADGNGDGILADNEVLQENHYYPFGMSIGDLAVDRGADNKLKFGGKELQDDQLNGISIALYDFEARLYDFAVPRFMTMDPLAEVIPDVNPYHYCYNNPISLIDPTGMAASVNDMIQEAWDATPENGSSYTTYKDGKKTGRIVTENVEKAVNEFLVAEGVELFKDDLDSYANGQIGKLSIEKKEVNQKYVPIFETIIMIGGMPIKVRIQYLSGDFVSVRHDGASMQLSQSLVSHDTFTIFNSNGKVAAYVWILQESKENYSKGGLLRQREGYLKGAKEYGDKRYIEYYEKKLEEAKKGTKG